MKKLVHFGAGKIGRSFIGQLFSRAGYEVIFVDVSWPLIHALNRAGKYRIVIKSDQGDEEIWIDNIRALHVDQKEEIALALSAADISGISVGPQAIKHIVPLLAAGLEMRVDERGIVPLDVILAENMRDAEKYVKGLLVSLLPENYPAEQMVGLIETSIGKMVPIMTSGDLEKDPLVIFAEPYNTLILDGTSFKNQIPDVHGLSPKQHMKAWVDRKSFIHNLGHAATAYFGHLFDPAKRYLYEVLQEREVYCKVRETMLQSAEILMKEYPGEFTMEQLVEHVDDLISRFSNTALGDTVFRVGRDLYRKLSAEDRLIGAVHLGRKHSMPVDKIMYISVCATFFKACDEYGKMDPKDVAFMNKRKLGLEHVLSEVCGLKRRNEPDLFEMALKYEKEIQQRFIDNEKQ